MRRSPVARTGLDGLWLAVGTLTAVPVPPVSRLDAGVARTAMLLAPVVGAGLGAVVAGVVVAADAAGLSPVAGICGVGVLALLTRGLHLDGLADAADGLASGYDRARALEVMRRGDVGPAGVATLVLVLLAQATLLGPLGAPAVVVAVVASRAVLPLLCTPAWGAARPGGLGATVLGSVPGPLGAGVVAAAATAALVAGWRGPVAVAVAASVAVAVAAHARRRLGGLTGDVLGAAVELALVAALIVLSTVPGG